MRGPCSEVGLTLYDLEALLFNFTSPSVITRSSEPTATMSSVSFMTIACLRPEGVGSSFSGSAEVNLESVLADSSYEAATLAPGRKEGRVWGEGR